MDELRVPITETPNELTRDLDISEPIGMARLFRQSDEQMFTGWRPYPSLSDEQVVETCARLATVAARVISAGQGGVIFLSGAGTSGRFAQLLSRQFNRILRNAHQPEIFRPLVAGGALALARAQEGAEDDPVTAARDLENNMPDEAQHVLYIGITCGLSAPYTAGQMDYLAGKPDTTITLLGFNPAHQARDVEIEGWDKTFKQVLDTLLEAENFILLNPVYGPESVMGSTRLKGGSATKILLETIFYTALEMAGIMKEEEGARLPTADDPKSVERRVRQYFRRYRETMHAVYEHVEVLESLIKQGGATLRSGGKITYLGRETAGMVALIDASECPPTFGATFEDVRGYLRGGWPELLDSDRDLEDVGPEYQIDLDSFEKNKLPDLAKGDLVLGVAIGEIGPKTRMLLEHAAKTKATVGVVLVTVVAPKKDDLPVGADQAHIIEIPSLGFQPGFFNLAEFALKLALNALTTGAHVMIGKVYENRMIDLRISNNKLYFRAIRIIQKLAGCTDETARRALHRSVFRKDALSSDESSAAPSTVIKAGTDATRVVPTALLLAMGDMTYDQACDLLAQDPVPRRVIKAQIEKQKDTGY